MDKNFNIKDFSLGSVRRIARKIVVLRDEKRKAVLRSLPTDMKCRIVEEMVSIRLDRLRNADGVITPTKVSES